MFARSALLLFPAAAISLSAARTTLCREHTTSVGPSDTPGAFADTQQPLTETPPRPPKRTGPTGSLDASRPPPLGAAAVALDLVHAQIFVRHGDRTPGSELGADFDPEWWADASWQTHFPETWADMNEMLGEPYRVQVVPRRQRGRSSAWKDTGFIDARTAVHRAAVGQLTHIGWAQCRALGDEVGAYLAAMGLLSRDGSAWVPEVFIESTNFRRTIQSATAFVTGFRGPGAQPEDHAPSENDDAAWCDIHVCSDFHDEILFPRYDQCPPARRLYRRISRAANAQANEQSPEAMALRDRLAVVENASHVDLQPRGRLMRMFDAVVCRKAHNLPIPDHWFGGDAQWSALQDYIRRRWVYWYRKRTMLRWTMGRCFRRVLTRLDNAVCGMPQEKVFLSFGHDTTIFPLLCGLSLDFDEWPSYAANIAIELYRVDPTVAEQRAQMRQQGRRWSEWYVRIVYDGTPVTPRGYHDPLLTLDEFRRLIGDLALASISECRL